MPANKPKRVTVHVIDRFVDSKLYARLDAIIREWHPHLTDANIVLAWNSAWKADVDGRVTLGKCKKASDLERELFATVSDDGEAKQLDAVILLNEEAWQTLTEEQQTALLDHEISHLAIVEDENGDPKHDECGRLIYRIRKHDLEEFRDVVQRHGMYRHDIEEFVKSASAAKRAPLLKIAEA